MDDPPLYTACIPVLLRCLASLRRVVVAVEALPQDVAQGVLVARLAPEMLPFHAQAATAAQFARRTAFPLAGRPVPAFVPAEARFAVLCQRVDQVAGELRTLTPSDFSGASARVLAERAGAAELRLPAAQFLHEYPLPNFFFHLNMAYAIARAHGAALGKGTYDGFHVYANGA